METQMIEGGSHTRRQFLRWVGATSAMAGGLSFLSACKSDGIVDATSVPVLLSLLVLIFTAGGEDLTKLPSNRIELYELGIDSAIAKRLRTKRQENDEAVASSGEATDVLIRRWMMLFNLDRTQMAADDDTQLTEKKREHRPSRKQAIKFDEIEGNQAGGAAGSKGGSGGRAPRTASSRRRGTRRARPSPGPARRRRCPAAARSRPRRCCPWRANGRGTTSERTRWPRSRQSA